MIDELKFKEILGLSEEYKKCFDELFDQLIKDKKFRKTILEYKKARKPIRLSVLLQKADQELVNMHLQKYNFNQDFNLANGFFIFKDPDTQESSIKLHIPLSNYWKDGMLIANLIIENQNINQVKLHMPVKNIDNLSPQLARGLFQTPITIYLEHSIERNISKDLSDIPDDNRLYTLEEFAYTIHQIDKIFDQISSLPIDDEGNTYGDIVLSEEIAESDIRIGKYTTLTIDSDNNGNYINAFSKYRQGSDGGFTKVDDTVDNEGRLGYQIRHDLINNSSEVANLQKILPFADIFHEINEYINLNAKEVSDFDFEETKQEISTSLFFREESALTPSKMLLVSLRNIVLNGADINSELGNLESNPDISRNEHLMELIGKFRENYLALNFAPLNEDISPLSP